VERRIEAGPLWEEGPWKKVPPLEEGPRKVPPSEAVPSLEEGLPMDAGPWEEGPWEGVP